VYSDELLRPWFDAVLSSVPGIALFDAHTHTGTNDPDGYRCTAEQLIRGLDEAGGARAVVFTMHEPAGYTAANDRIIDEAEASDGRLVPFARLDPAHGPLAEAERALARGARGIKLHPRAEGFRLDDRRMAGVYALLDERRLPLITHAGRGIPALGRDALEITARHTGLRLILAHDGVSDLGWLWRHAPDHPNLFFDTAWWSALDHLTLFGLVPPGQIVFGSDMPYGTTLLAATMAFRCALQTGLTREQLDAIAGRQLERLLGGEEPIDAGPAPGPRVEADILLQRVHGYLVSAVGRMFIGNPAPDYVGLARLACEVGEDSPHAHVFASVLDLLDRMEEYADSVSLPDPVPGGPVPPYPGVAMAIVAAHVALTPDVPVP
jgi:predicted TIM-barrel fold metal-dependent hydrolase